MTDHLNINDKPELLVSIVGLIDRISLFVTQTVNQELILPDWKIGKNINDGFYRKIQLHFITFKTFKLLLSEV